MIQVVKVGQSERIFLSAGQMCCSLRFRVRRQSAEKKKKKLSVRDRFGARVSQSYGGEQFALNFAQDLNTRSCCINVVSCGFSVFFFQSDAPGDRGL